MAKEGLTKNLFLQLYLATSVINNTSIIDEKKFEKNLYKFYFEPKYKILFKNTIVKANKDEKYNYVDLEREFKNCNAVRLIEKLDDDNKYYITLSIEQAAVIINRFHKEYQNTIDDLFMTIEKEKEQKNPKIKHLILN